MRSFLHHSACVWGVTALPPRPALAADAGSAAVAAAADDLPDNAFVTCSADNTVRVWHLGKGRSADAAKRGGWGSVYSRELLRMIRTGDASAAATAAGQKRFDAEIPEKPVRRLQL